MCGADDPATVDEALAMLDRALAMLTAADAALLPAEVQARALRALERAEARHTAARARMLAAFSAQGGYEDDGHGSARVWLRWQTRVTKGAAAGAAGWMRRLAAHPVIAQALAGGEISASWAKAICGWSDRLASHLRDDADQILAGAAAAGAELADLAGLAEQIYQRAGQRCPNGDDDGFDDRGVGLDITFRGAGRLNGDLTPGCAAAGIGGIGGAGKAGRAGRYAHRLSAPSRRPGGGMPAPHRRRYGAGPGRAAHPDRPAHGSGPAARPARRTRGRSRLGGGPRTAARLAGRPRRRRRRLRRHHCAHCHWARGPGRSRSHGRRVPGRARAGRHHPRPGRRPCRGRCLRLPLWRLHLCGSYPALARHPWPAPRVAAGDGRRCPIRPGWLAAWLRHSALGGGPGDTASLPLSVPLPLDAGEAEPTIPAHLRRAVTTRHSCCAFPGCDQPASMCQIHHLIPRSQGGPTALHNLITLCAFHHQVVIHRWGWALTLHPNGTTTAASPDGRRVFHSHGPPRQAA
jgi:HNH endonuclease